LTRIEVRARAAGRSVAADRPNAHARPSAEITRGTHPPPSLVLKMDAPFAGSSRIRLGPPASPVTA
jgi:hypothetical protein